MSHNFHDKFCFTDPMTDPGNEPSSNHFGDPQRATWHLLLRAWRGDWRALAPLSCVLWLFLNPLTLPNLLQALGVPSPAWYPAFWTVVFVVLIVLAIVVRRRPSTRAPAPGIRPTAIRGLLSYTETDSEIFLKLGREGKLRELTTLLARPDFRFGVVAGVSGAGKTSFVRAGLIPWLNREGSGHVALYVKCTEMHPVQTLLTVVRRRIQTSMSSSQSVVKLLGQLQETEGKDCVVVFDQFEQFFVHHTSPERRDLLTNTLRGLWKLSNPPKIIVCLREDFVGQLIPLQADVPYALLSTHSVSLRRFEVDEAVEILTLLAKEDDIPIDEHAIRSLIERDLTDDQGRVSPVDLQIVAWIVSRQAVSSDRKLTPAVLSELGGVHGLMASFVQTTLSNLATADEKNLALNVLVALTDFANSTRAGTLTVGEVQQRLSASASTSDVERMLDWLCRAEIRLVTDHYEDGDVQYELAHERLIESLRHVAGSGLARADKARHLVATRTSLWIASGRRRQQLLDLRELREVTLARPSDGLVRLPAQREFLDASRQRNRKFLLRCLIAGLSLVVVWLWSVSPWHVRRQALAQLSGEVGRASGQSAREGALALALVGNTRLAVELASDAAVDTQRELIRLLVAEAQKTGDWSSVRDLSESAGQLSSTEAAFFREHLVSSLWSAPPNDTVAAALAAEEAKALAADVLAGLKWDLIVRSDAPVAAEMVLGALDALPLSRRPFALVDALDKFGTDASQEEISVFIEHFLISARGLNDERERRALAQALAPRLRALRAVEPAVEIANGEALAKEALRIEDVSLRVSAALFVAALASRSNVDSFREASRELEGKDYLAALNAAIPFAARNTAGDGAVVLWNELATKILSAPDSTERAFALRSLSQAGDGAQRVQLLERLVASWRTTRLSGTTRPEWLAELRAFFVGSPHRALSIALPVANASRTTVNEWELVCTAYIDAVQPVSAANYEQARRLIKKIELPTAQSRCLVRFLASANKSLVDNWDPLLARAIVETADVAWDSDARVAFDASVAAIRISAESPQEDLEALLVMLRRLELSPSYVLTRDFQTGLSASQEREAVTASLTVASRNSRTVLKALTEIAAYGNESLEVIVNAVAEQLVPIASKKNDLTMLRDAADLALQDGVREDAAIAASEIASQMNDENAARLAVEILGMLNEVHYRTSAGEAIVNKLIAASYKFKSEILMSVAVEAALVARSAGAYATAANAAYYKGDSHTTNRLLRAAETSSLGDSEMTGIYSLIDLAAKMGRWRTAFLLAQSSGTRSTAASALAHLVIRWELQNTSRQDGFILHPPHR